MSPATQAQRKQEAADAALKLLPEAGLIGLGSGSTAELFIRGVGRLVAAGRRLTGVPTSQRARELAESLGIPLLDDSGINADSQQPWELAVCVDGADEVSDQLDLIKGGGGCHSREKIVNYCAALNVIVVDDTKLVKRLGETWPIPVEVLGFGHLATKAKLERLGETKLRLRDGQPWITDAGNYIYDVRVAPIHEPAPLDAALKAIPGVVETGLFVGRADVVLVAGGDGVRELRRA